MYFEMIEMHQKKSLCKLENTKDQNQNQYLHDTQFLFSYSWTSKNLTLKLHRGPTFSCQKYSKSCMIEYLMQLFLSFAVSGKSFLQIRNNKIFLQD